jgi:hypothetical protein
MSLLDRITDRVVAYGQGVVTRVLSGAMDATRSKALDELDALYRGRQYEGRGLAPAWDKAPQGARRVALRQQKPSVQYDLPRVIVDRPAAMLFGEGRMPAITFDPAEKPAATADANGDGVPDAAAEINGWFDAIADEGDLAPQCLVMARQGEAIGSGAMTWAVVEGEFEFQAHKASDCVPTFHPRKRGRLTRLEKRYKFKRAIQELQAGVLVTIEREFWHREVWDEQTHTVFQPAAVAADGREPTWAVADATTHGFGFVPGAWVKNIDDGEPSRVDGVSLLDGIADLTEDIDRTLSAKSRAIRYNQDPERVYFGLKPEDVQRLQVGGGASTSLPKKTDGADVEVLELKGDGQRLGEEHVVAQRGRVLETTRVTMPDPERLLAAAKSGVALRLLFAPTLELVGELRQSYGRALRTIFNQILRAAREGKLGALGALATPPPARIPGGKAKLTWGRIFDPTPEDLEIIARAASTLYAAKLMDRETLVRWLSNYLDIKDVQAVLRRLEDEEAELAPLRPPGAPASPQSAGATDDEEDEDAEPAAA